MNIIITMAGAGSRFRKVGYNCPKYMIEAKGKTLFEWSMDSLVDYFSYTSKVVFVVKKEDNSRNFIEKMISNYKINSFEIVELDGMTDGQATTAYIGMASLSDDESVVIYNIDTYIENGGLLYNDLIGDGHIPCFKAQGDHWSFVEEKNGKVIRVTEKDRISDNCSLGVYYFSKCSIFKDIYENFDFFKYNKEKYIAPMYNSLIANGLEVTYSIVEIDKVHILGTPEELEEFIRG